MYFRKFSLRRRTSSVALRPPLRDILASSLIVMPPIGAEAKRRVNSLTIGKVSRVGIGTLSSVSLNKSLESEDELLSESDELELLDESRAEFS